MSKLKTEFIPHVKKKVTAGRFVISKSAKRKMSTQGKKKADGYTQMVVYKAKGLNGKMKSITKHELIKKHSDN